MKKVFIGVLAALMLFAFTACDNGTSSDYVEKTIVMIEASTTSEYLVGETPNPADFTFTGYTATGSAVTLPSNQFVFDGYDEGGLNPDADNNANVYFNWAETKMGAKGSAKFYAAEDVSVSVGSAKDEYFTVTAGTAIDSLKNVDFSAIDPEGLVITVKYDGTKTKDFTIADEKTKLLGQALTYQFGTVDADGDFTAETSEPTKVPTTAGAYAIQVSASGTEIGTYPVVVETNKVEKTELHVADNYVVFTDGSSADALDPEKVYVTKEMSNGQILIVEDNSDIFWTDDEADFATATSSSANGVDDVTIKAEAGTVTTVYAKYVGLNCSDSYSRKTMSEKFTATADKVTGVTVEAYGATIAQKAYDNKDTKVSATDVTGIKVTEKHLNPANDTTLSIVDTVAETGYCVLVEADNLTADGIMPGDSVEITIKVYNNKAVVNTVKVNAEVTA